MIKGILSISGQPGLYKQIAEAKNRIIVESLTTGKRMPASGSAKISSLEEIAVFTREGDIPLREVFKRISEHENGGFIGDPKNAGADVKNYFMQIVPEYDQERVYVSDIRKILIWYNLLQQKGLLDFTKEESEAEPSDEPSPGSTSPDAGVPSE